jgi:hypothetical protein
VTVSVEQVADGRGLDEFIRFPRRLHRGEPCYVPPLDFERRQFFDRRRNPFFGHAEVDFFLARSSSGDVLGRVTAHVDRNYNEFHGTKTGHFGFFDAVDDPEVAAALLGAVENSLRGRGMDEVLGPFHFTTNDEVGVLVRGFDSPPFIMMPWNPPCYDPLITGRGYVKAMDLFAYFTRYSTYDSSFVARVAARARRSGRIEVRNIDMKRFDRELALVKTVYNQAWSKNWGFVPMTEAELDYLAASLKPLVDPRLVYFAFVDGEPAGFFMAAPDFNVVLRRMGGRLLPFGWLRFLLGRRGIRRYRVLTMGVVERHRLLGIESIILDELYRQGLAAGYDEVEFSWVLEDNAVMNTIARRFSPEPYKVYRVYRKDL